MSDITTCTGCGATVKLQFGTYRDSRGSDICSGDTGKYHSVELPPVAIKPETPQERIISYAEIPWIVQQLITAERWDAMTISQQRDWAMYAICDEYEDKRHGRATAIDAIGKPMEVKG